MLAINVSILNLMIARLVQFWPWHFDVWTTNMNAHNWLTEQEHRRLTDVGESELRKGQAPQNLQKWLHGVVKGHSRSFAMSPLSGYIWFLIVIRSNDRAISYFYRDITWYYVKNREIFPLTYNLPRRSLSTFNRPPPNLVNIIGK